MIRFAANLTLLFTEVPPLERPGLARAAGFDGVEILFPYDHPAEDWRRALDGQPLALINVPPGDWAAGERGSAALPGQEARFRDDFARALDMARTLRAGCIHVMAGNAVGAESETTFVENLRAARRMAGDLPLTIEPLNPGDMPGYFLADFDLAERVIARLGDPGTRLQFDFWHATRIAGDADRLWARLAPLVGHVQIASLTTRQEPDHAMSRLLSKVAGQYEGWVSAEYQPSGRTTTGLGWLAEARLATGIAPRHHNNGAKGC